MGSRLAALSIALLAAAPVQARSGDALPRISSYFGTRSDPLNGDAALHRGIDIPGPPGTTVMAAAAGTVRFAGRRGGHGNLIEIAHADGSVTRYGHLSRILVVPGMALAQGETIALMGSTGRSTGNHLHFELLVDGRHVDPLHYLSETMPAPRRVYPMRRTPAPAQPPFRSAFAIARDSAGLGTDLPGKFEIAAEPPRK